jgi:nitroreductase
LGIPVVMETSDRGMPDIERFDLEPNRPLFHGLAGDVDHRTLRGLTFEEKVPHVLAITGIETLSVRMKASMVEVGQSIATWPQIASAVALGGALGADACRRIALGQACASGRRYVDLDELVGGSDPVVCAADAAEKVITDDAGLANGAARRLSDGVRPSDDDERAVSDSSQIAELVGAGIQAPSAANHQPWEWVIAGGSLFLFHDARRSASLDFLPDASYVALGAAAENVVLAAHERGLEVDLCPLPVPGDQRLAAAFRFFASPRAGRSEPHNWDELAAAIPLRHTNRCRWERQPLEPATVVCLRATAESVAGARLRLLTDDDELASIGQILGAADRVRLFHRPSHRDLMDELRWTPEEAETTRDGIDLATLELSPLDAAGLRICRDWAVVEQVRQWRGGRVLEQSAIRAVRGASAVALLTMPCSDLAAYFTGGRAMQRFWLAATRSRLAVQPLSALPYLFARFVRNGPGDFPAELAEELKALRERYRALFPINDQTAEIFLFRLGVAVQPSARSLRRPIADVFRYAEDWERTDLP